MKKQKNNRGKEALIFAMLTLVFICSCILATSIASASAQCSTCENYDPNAANPYCGDGKIIGASETIIAGITSGEECDCGNNETDCYISPDCKAGEKCIYCQCTAKHEPSDSICSTFPPGYFFIAGADERTYFTCNTFNVLSTNPNFLDYIAQEALDCCVSHSTVSPYNIGYCVLAHLEDPQTSRDCVTEFITYGLSDGRYPIGNINENLASWIQGYFRAEMADCCKGDAATCAKYSGILGQCSPKEPHWNDYVNKLTCVTGSDCYWIWQPALKTATVLNTGTCADWSTLTTTLLRKTGLFHSHYINGGKAYLDDVYSVNDMTHVYSLVYMDKYGKWLFLDYGEIVLSPKYGWYNYCNSKGSNYPNYLLSDNLIYSPLDYGTTWPDFVKNNVYGCG